MFIFDWFKHNAIVNRNRYIISSEISKAINQAALIDNAIIREYIIKVITAAAASLEKISLQSPEEYKYFKPLNHDEVLFWIKQVSLAIIGYSMHMLMVTNIGLQSKYNEYWDRIIYEYDKVFSANITKKDANCYAIGLIEENVDLTDIGILNPVSLRCMLKDAATISKELLKYVWGKGVDDKDIEIYLNIFTNAIVHGSKSKDDQVSNIPINARSVVFMGAAIWKAYQYYVQPYFSEKMKEDIDNYIS